MKSTFDNKISERPFQNHNNDKTFEIAKKLNEENYAMSIDIYKNWGFLRFFANTINMYKLTFKLYSSY